MPLRPCAASLIPRERTLQHPPSPLYSTTYRPGPAQYRELQSGPICQELLKDSSSAALTSAECGRQKATIIALSTLRTVPRLQAVYQLFMELPFRGPMTPARRSLHVLKPAEKRVGACLLSKRFTSTCLSWFRHRAPNGGPTTEFHVIPPGRRC